MGTKKEIVRSIFLIIIGSTILSFGNFNFNYQNSITEGGILGLLLLIKNVFDISPSITSLVIDLSLFVLGVKFFGKKFLLYSILATITFSNTYRLWEHIGFLIPSLSHNMFLASILAGIFVGIGVGLVVRGGGASGGDDVIALIANKLIKIKINHVYLITDSIVLLLSLVYLDMKQLFFSIIAVTISGKIISMLYNGDDEDKDEVNEDKNKEMLNLEVNE